jgi:hypothetical protein
MGKVLGFLMVMGLLPVLAGKRLWLQVCVVILFLSAGLGIFEFYRWGFNEPWMSPQWPPLPNGARYPATVA